MLDCKPEPKNANSWNILNILLDSDSETVARIPQTSFKVFALVFEKEIVTKITANVTVFQRVLPEGN